MRKASTNIIESIFARHEELAHRVKRSRHGFQALRWAAASLPRAEQSLWPLPAAADLFRLAAALEQYVRGQPASQAASGDGESQRTEVWSPPLPAGEGMDCRSKATRRPYVRDLNSGALRIRWVRGRETSGVPSGGHRVETAATRCASVQDGRRRFYFTFVLTNQPAFVKVNAGVVGLKFHDSRDNLCVDEKSQVQAINRTKPLLPPRPGQVERHTHDYERHVTVTLFAALNIATGEVDGECYRRHRHQEFLRFFRRLDTAYPDGEIHLILNNCATHKHQAAKWRLPHHPRVPLHFMPMGAFCLSWRRYGSVCSKVRL